MAEPTRPVAAVRVALGTAQVMAATVALYLLLIHGVTDLTVWATAATAALMVFSRLLFQKLDRKE